MPKGMLIGYARTSTVEQEAGLEAQVRDLEAAGCDKLFQEQRSSVDAKRVKLDAAIEFAREGDVLVVTKLDRLARSVGNLVDIQRQLEAKGVTLRILAINLDTATPTGKLMVNMLGSVAQFERELMLERQREGIAKAKGEGKYKGRAPTAQRQAKEIIRLKMEGVKVPEIVTTLGVSRASIFRILKEQAAEAA
ncbi:MULTISPECIES: recombinase family protein [unclassified Mesorhizobium]|uniref:recombinase family protein n=1 Tax=unclassified Mesorhizobium TaxID=325217 RepID=UPI000BAFDC0F|nr:MULTISPECIES: recombinase family protein [unclassified Mesorhizobium]PBB23342.1 DNA invertase [Mesorhizobium sp. WSM4304]PBB71912.1 DNA invertase [Mesorhizobium sp. WSM4308]